MEFSSAQTRTVKFGRGKTARAYSRSVKNIPQSYRIFIRRGSQLFIGLDGKVDYKISSGGRQYEILSGGLVGLKNSAAPLGTETKYLIKVFSGSKRRENYRVNFSATALK